MITSNIDSRNDFHVNDEANGMGSNLIQVMHKDLKDYGEQIIMSKAELRNMLMEIESRKTSRQGMITRIATIASRQPKRNQTNPREADAPQMYSKLKRKSYL